MVETDLFEEKKPKAVLVALSEGAEESVVEASLAELEALLETAGGECAFTVVQNLDRPNTKTYIGSGKAKEIAEAVAARGDIDLVIFDNELSPAQLNNLEDIIGVRIIDRTMLILDIFALHATTGEGKLQVEIACLRYTAPRLTGKGTELSRLGGGIGTRGPGESKLESDRRHLKRRIAALEEELAEMQRTRDTKRAARDKKGLKIAAIVGYTNSGKSTLLNYLTGAGILAENKLFATLDPTTRLLTTEDGTEILITDTVGF
ncbi:MAG: GTPase HflX, partial [Clostridia bacterium]|nr:GTPase HflX [Clostridia bacterium]